MIIKTNRDEFILAYRIEGIRAFGYKWNWLTNSWGKVKKWHQFARYKLVMKKEFEGWKP